jgi:hypothetical protein
MVVRIKPAVGDIGRRVEQQLILDRYRPLAELGEGGYGVVVLAWDTRMQRRVAIKRLPLPLDASGEVLRHPPGLAEARTAAMLNHPAIVTVYDFATDSDEAFLIMEFVDGCSLDALLDRLRGPLDADETAALIGAVAAALEFAHANGVLHLDIKPGNVLIARDGRIKVADFGMAALSSATGHGSGNGGTLGYMPIEQLDGLSVDESTDEWALAVLAYECLTGTNPFVADSVQQARVRLQTLDPAPPSASKPHLGAAVDDVLLAALGPYPDDRYPGVTAFADALLPHLGDPEAGLDSLAELAEAHSDIDSESAENPDWERIGLWDRLQGRLGFGILRGVAAVESAWLTWAGLSSLGIEPFPLVMAACAAGVAGGFAPTLGTGLGLIAFTIGLYAQHLWLVATAFGVGAVAWWWFVARKSAGAAVLPLSAPLLAAARVPYAMPLLAGFVLPPLQAASAALVGGTLVVLAACASGSGVPYAVVDPLLFVDPQRILLAGSLTREAFSQPATWIVLAGWPLSAVVMSLLARRASRLFALLGTVLGGAVLYGTQVLAGQAAHDWGNGAVWSGTSFLISLVASLILVGFVAALGAPLRAEEEGVAGEYDHYSEDDEAWEEAED